MSSLTDFGFRQVPEAEKASLVGGVFTSVAPHYDLMNDLMSAGMHRLWKDRLIAKLRPKPAMHLLDVAGGTGDIAFRFLKEGGGRVTLADLNAEMLEEGRKRALDLNLGTSADHPIAWQEANAEALPFANDTFDAYTISFGIRNVTHIEKVLAEAHRVLKRGGHFLCLEFSHPRNPWVKRLYDRYSFHVIPKIGEAVTQDRDAYQYLVESIRRFPKPDAFAAMIRNAGFGNVTISPLTFGVVAIHSGWKL